MRSKPSAVAGALRRQVFRFAMVGAAATLAHIVTALALHGGMGLSALWANFVAFCSAVLVSYFGHHGWTFAAKGHHGVSFPRFLSVALAGLALNQAIVYLMVELAGWPYGLALAVVVLVVPSLGFLLIRNWAFSAST